MVGIRAIGLGIGLAFLASTPAAAYTGYVTNEGDDDVSVLDTAVGAAGAKAAPDIAVEAGPGPIAAAPDGKSAWVVNVAGGTGVGSISVINTQTRTLSGAAFTPDGTEGPSGIAFTPNGSEVYVPNLGGGNVFAIDTATRTDVLTPVGTGGDQMAVATNPALAEAYVTDLGPDPGTDPAEMSTVDTAAKTSDPGDDVSVGDPGNLPTGVAVNPGGTKAYVVNGDDGDVSIVDLTTDPPTNSGDIAVGGAPSAIAIGPAGTKAYVTNSGDDTVTPIDLSDDSTDAPIALDGGSSPSAVAFTPEGARAYVVNKGTDDVTAINAATDARIGSDIAVGDQPAGIALFTAPAVTPPPTTSVPEVPVTPLPDPEPGETINLTPVEGTVETKCGDERSFSALAVAAQIPVGCVIDATRGTVEIVAATALRASARASVTRSLETQTAFARAGRFRVVQDAVRAAGRETAVAAAVTLRLAGPLVARRVRIRGSGEPVGDAALRRKLARRRLWVTAEGRWKTEGKRGIAKPRRATTWLTEDRSDKGTKVRVTDGKLEFKDKVKRRAVKVPAGTAYMARER